MRRIALFCEDFAHESFLSAIVRRVARESGLSVEITPRSVRGGHGKVIDEFREFLRELDRPQRVLADLLVVATDANCRGLQERTREIYDGNEKYRPFIIPAIPDPHIERWLLLDSAAFKKVLGRGCAAPDYKCERDRYKRSLIEAVRAAGVTPLLGGVEYAEDIAEAMDLMQGDKSFSTFLSELRAKLIEWAGRK